jgi:hypothetical protein
VQLRRINYAAGRQTSTRMCGNRSVPADILTVVLHLTQQGETTSPSESGSWCALVMSDADVNRVFDRYRRTMSFAPALTEAGNGPQGPGC